MPKYYKVSLYDGNVPFGSFHTVGEIIVKKSLFSVTEILTGYKLDTIECSAPSRYYAYDTKIKLYGHQPTVPQDQFVPKNFATPQDIDAYVDNYDSSEWKRIYEEMKLFTTAEKLTIASKVKQISGTKK